MAFLGGSLVCAAGGVVASIALARGLRLRIARISRNADRLARGLEPELLDDGGDELAELSRRLDQAGRLLRDREQALERANRALQARSDELQAANQELESFSYSVSHDLRAPLRAIDGFSQAIEEEQAGRLDAAGHDALRRVRAAAGRMSTLIDAMLTLARLTRLELRREPVSVTEIAATRLCELARQHPERQVRTSVAAGMTARADPRLLRIAIENLIDNAWKYTGKTADAAIDVGIDTSGAESMFFVRDTGAGFDMRYADKLFGAFQRLHADREFEGTGIGLATVKRVIARHGGRVWATAAPGAGATFFFTLPPPPEEPA